MKGSETSYRRREDWALGIAAAILTSSLGFAGTQLWNLSTKVASLEEKFVTKEEVRELRAEVRIMRSRQDERTPIWETIKSCVYKLKC